MERLAKNGIDKEILQKLGASGGFNFHHSETDSKGLNWYYFQKDDDKSRNKTLYTFTEVRIKEMLKLQDDYEKDLLHKTNSMPIFHHKGYLNKIPYLLGLFNSEISIIEPDETKTLTNEMVLRKASMDVKMTFLNMNDCHLLLYLNALALDNGSRTITTTLYEIAQKAFYSVNGNIYDIARTSLKALHSCSLDITWREKEFNKKRDIQEVEKRELFHILSVVRFEDNVNQTGKILIELSDTYYNKMLSDKKYIIYTNRKVLASLKSDTAKKILLFLATLRENSISLKKIKEYAMITDIEDRRVKPIVIKLLPKIEEIKSSQNNKVKAYIKDDILFIQNSKNNVN